MWWRTLGVEPTDDKETVKKAYADMLKTIDQDKEIDTFTMVHKAYRMALKSLREKEQRIPSREGLINYEGKTHWYLEELAKIYNNPRRRLKTDAWKDLFACMSFIEEKHFLGEYVSFFNEHYALTEDIWALIERYYPLSRRGDFRWPEIVNGYLGLSVQEIKGMSFMEASNYVTYKIHAFYGILDGDYERAMLFLKMLIGTYDRDDLNQWYLVTAIELNIDEDIEKAYGRMKKNERTKAMGNYLYCGYLEKSERYDQAAGLIRMSPEDMTASALKILSAEQRYMMGVDREIDGEQMPWYQLELISPKAEKLLAKGQYKKTQQTESVKKRWPFGGR